MNDLGLIALHEPGAAFIARRKLFELVQACGGDEAREVLLSKMRPGIA